MALPIDIEGPVRAEVFVVYRDGERLLVTGPCGPGPWLIETHGNAHPLDLVRSITARVVGEASLLHSTSWRWDAGAVVLTFLVVVSKELARGMDAEPVERSALARGGAVDAPESIRWREVLEHALRHLAWLAKDDDVVGATLDGGWRDALSHYVPAPFQQLTGEETA